MIKKLNLKGADVLYQNTVPIAPLLKLDDKQLSQSLTAANIEDDDISAKVSSINGKNMAKIKLTLDSSEPPEGIARLRQELIKILPS